mmetsp:Transcript_5476/g.10438  ORF Transcript_5476/g.10438 Transcript_5476/m.10438 type:complete len:307 (+) Transcript_5476:51-971(+)
MVKRTDLQKWCTYLGIKKTGSKQELEDRVNQPLISNDRCWSGRTKGIIDNGEYFTCGAHKKVYKCTYTSGPRKGETCVSKVFKTGHVYENSSFTEDLAAVKTAAPIIKAFNDTQATEKAETWVYLNKPEIWYDLQPDSRGRKSASLVEPFIEGGYTKFNSNTGFATAGHELMQALSHFSYHHSEGRFLICDLQGGKGFVPGDGYGHFFLLTDPAICSSKRGTFGPADLGQDGIDNFFGWHKCTRFCCPSWRLPPGAVRRFKAVPGTTLGQPAPSAAVVQNIPRPLRTRSPPPPSWLDDLVFDIIWG